MRYYIIAGEASGDLHASNLVKALSLLDKKATFRGIGGDLMAAAGVQLLAHYKETAYMGFTDVLLHLRKILKSLSLCKKDMALFAPDSVILVDYPGFNLRMAEFAHKQRWKVHYYISPQLWAWKKGRIQIIKKYVDTLFVILPFEKEFYKKHNYEVDFVGHPLLDVIHNDTSTLPTLSIKTPQPIIALLPGSRKQEIKKILPLMLEMTSQFPSYLFIIAGAPSISADFYQSIIKDKNIPVVYKETYVLLKASKAALVTSGTATLETALFKIPQVVCYKTNYISYQLAKFFVGKNIQYISLVNLIANKLIVSELIQDKLNPIELKKELALLLSDKNKQEEITLAYHELADLLGGEGASKRTAAAIYSHCISSQHD